MIEEMAAVRVSDSVDPEICGMDPKLLRQLAEDDVDQSIIKEELHHLSQPGSVAALTFREKLVQVLRNSVVEGFKLALILLDAIILLAIIILDMYIVEAELEEKDVSGAAVLRILMTSCDNSTLALISEPISLDAAYDALMAAAKRTRDEYYSNTTAHHAALEQTLSELRHAVEGLHYTSIAILALFVFELILKIIGHGRRFIYYKLEVVDGIIIVASLAIDIFLTNKSVHDLSQALLIIFLMWRLIRIFNGIMITTKSRNNFRIRVLKKALKSSNEKTRSLQEQVASLEKAISTMRLMGYDNTKTCPQLDSDSMLSDASKATLRSAQLALRSALTQMATWSGRLQRRTKKHTLTQSSSSSKMSFRKSLEFGVYMPAVGVEAVRLRTAASEKVLAKYDQASLFAKAEANPQLPCHSRSMGKRSSSEADLTEEPSDQCTPTCGRYRRLSARRGSAEAVLSSARDGAETGTSRQSSYDVSSLDTGVSLTSLLSSSLGNDTNNNSEPGEASAKDDEKCAEAISSIRRQAHHERKAITWSIDQLIPEAPSVTDDVPEGAITKL